MTTPVVRTILEFHNESRSRKNPALLYLERSDQESQAGQLCLPGGKVEDTHQTAIRSELEEEIGYELEKSYIEPTQYLFSHPENNGYREDFFRVTTGWGYDRLSLQYVRDNLNNESRNAHILTLEDVQSRNDIAWSNDTAHICYTLWKQSRNDFTNPDSPEDQDKNLLSWMLNGEITEPVTMPSYKTITEYEL